MYTVYIHVDTGFNAHHHKFAHKPVMITYKEGIQCVVQYIPYISKIQQHEELYHSTIMFSIK